MERAIQAMEPSITPGPPTPGGGGSSPPAPPTGRKHHGPRRRRLAAVSLVAVVALLSSGLTYLATRRGGTEDANGSVASIAVEETNESGSPSSASQMLERVLPSVVNVRVTQGVFDPFGGSREGTAEASGVVLSEDGIILTNSHVVEDASSVEVEFTDGHASMTGTVLGTDSGHDVAVIKVDATDLTPITVGASDSLSLGETVYAVGFPLELGTTVTEGIVSGIDRSIGVREGTGIRTLTGLLQTDAAINPGNSGGALVNASGELMGIPTAAAQASSAENVGFAISADVAIAAAQRLAA